jgi:hypothetical protein
MRPSNEATRISGAHNRNGKRQMKQQRQQEKPQAPALKSESRKNVVNMKQ